ncbi:SET domain-containing protein 9-like [Asterias rubens]|uniref:SET domain-containing protein 9-like n=1 Tax=Asterias rubens TaxID=7604 RepID=UPI00145573C8|nr:SET domain-containing protein 9-like [Asterias rubens]
MVLVIEMAKLLNTLQNRWKQYKYRFVPWIALNIRKGKVRTVEIDTNDKIIHDHKVEKSLVDFFIALSKSKTSDPNGFGDKSVNGHQGDTTRKVGKQCLQSEGVIRKCRTAHGKCVATNCSHQASDMREGLSDAGVTSNLMCHVCMASAFRQSFLGWNKELSWKELCQEGFEHLKSMRQQIGLSNVLNVVCMNSIIWLQNRRCNLKTVKEEVFSWSKDLSWCSPGQFETHKQYYVTENLHWCAKVNASLTAANSVRNFTTTMPTQNRTNHARTTEGSRVSRDSLDVMRRSLGFTVERQPSSIAGGGTGVFVTSGTVAAESVIALYPGTVYKSWEPILLQSLANPFIFRCLDGTLIDGNDKGLSRMIYRSCTQRDRMGPYLTSDLSWLTNSLANPMAIGQYINNQNTDNEANVAYQEFDVPESFPFHLLRYIPNAFYSSTYQQDDAAKQRLMRCVVLVSLREIQCGEELFSSYFTIVH